jgi:hypothetical protein
MSGHAIVQGQIAGLEEALIDLLYEALAREPNGVAFEAEHLALPSGSSGAKRQFLRTRFRTLFRDLVFMGTDASGRLDYHRSQKFEAFLRSALQQLGPHPAPDQLQRLLQGASQEEIRSVMARPGE